MANWLDGRPTNLADTPTLAQDLEAVEQTFGAVKFYDGGLLSAALFRVIEAARKTLAEGAPLFCLYCGLESPTDTPGEVLAAHIRVCPKHPLPKALAALEQAQRLAIFWERTTKGEPDACWPWTGTIDERGYGEVSIGQRGLEERWRAHRLSYTLFRGPIPEGKVVMHRCDNRPCVNPAHLETGSIADNNEDMFNKGRWKHYNDSKAECRHGHPLSGDNLYVKPNGDRQCRACNKDAKRRYEERRP